MDRLLDRLRPEPDEGTRAAIARTDRIHEQIEQQAGEVQAHSAFARRTIRENELQHKIVRALRGA